MNWPETDLACEIQPLPRKMPLLPAWPSVTLQGYQVTQQQRHHSLDSWPRKSVGSLPALRPPRAALNQSPPPISQLHRMASPQVLPLRPLLTSPVSCHHLCLLTGLLKPSSILSCRSIMPFWTLTTVKFPHRPLQLSLCPPPLPISSAYRPLLLVGFLRHLSGWTPQERWITGLIHWSDPPGQGGSLV